MNWKYLLGGTMLLVLLLAGIGAAAYVGVGPAPGGDTSGESIDDFPTGTEYDSDAAGAGESPPFSFVVDEIEECGQTCRDVTATLHNDMNQSASDVTVYTRIYAGQDNTDEGDLVWEGTDDVGTLDAESSHTTTKRVELSLQDARTVDQNNGWITIVTTIESDETTVTFKDSEQVA